MFCDHPNQVYVPVKSGSLVLGDARILHAAGRNYTEERRTFWYLPGTGARQGLFQNSGMAKFPHLFPAEIRKQNSNHRAFLEYICSRKVIILLLP